MKFDNIDISLKRLLKEMDTKSFKALSSGFGLDIISLDTNKDLLQHQKKNNVMRDEKNSKFYFFEVDNDLQKVSKPEEASLQIETKKIGIVPQKIKGNKFVLSFSKFFLGHICDLLVVITAFLFPTVLIRMNFSTDFLFLGKDLIHEINTLWLAQLSGFELCALIYLAYLVYFILFKVMVGKTIGQMLLAFKDYKKNISP